MSIGNGESGKRLARHFKTSQHAVIDEGHTFRWGAFIVERVVADQDILAQFSFRWIVVDGQKFRKNLLVYLAGKRLSFVDVLLAEAFGAVPENLVKENS